MLASAVGVLVFLIVFQQALLSGLVTEFVGAIRNQSADVLVYGDEARLNLQGSVVGPAVAEQVATVDGVEAAEPLGVATVTVRAGGELPGAFAWTGLPQVFERCGFERLGKTPGKRPIYVRALGRARTRRGKT